MKKIAFVLLCVCVLLCDLHAQKAQAPFRRLSYSQFLAEMQNSLYVKKLRLFHAYKYIFLLLQKTKVCPKQPKNTKLF
jgi:hypothetical protein